MGDAGDTSDAPFGITLYGIVPVDCWGERKGEDMTFSMEKMWVGASPASPAPHSLLDKMRMQRAGNGIEMDCLTCLATPQVVESGRRADMLGGDDMNAPVGQQPGDVQPVEDLLSTGVDLREPKSAAEFYAVYMFWPWQTPWMEAHQGRMGLVPEFCNGQFWHWCPACGRWGSFGIGVDLRRGDLGQWHCEQHRPASVGKEDK